MWKRRLILAGILLVLIAAGLIGWRTYSRLISNQELQDAIAEADRFDPGWRLEELEAKRAVMPAAENSADHVLAIKAMMPTQWPVLLEQPPNPDEKAANEDPRAVEYALIELPPELQLNAEQTRQLREDMEKVKEPLAKARALLNYRNGRYRVNWALDYDNSTLLPCHDSRTSFNLLWHDALLRAQDDDVDGALISVLSVLGAARSIGDEPCMISQFDRMAGEGSAIGTLERILAQGEAPPNSLANVQRAFEDEASQPLFLFGVRGHRAGHHRMMEAVENGNLRVSSWIAMGTGSPKGKLASRWEDISGEIEFRRSHAPFIRVMTEIVEIAKLPVEEQRPKIKSYIRSIDAKAAHGELPVYVGLMVPMAEGFGEGFWRSQALLRCAIVALAAERYRIAHGHWPDSLDTLVPEFIAKVPLDPYDSKPLRYRKLDDGVVIYSIGPDETDNGGIMDRADRHKPGTDMRFQLWNVNRRRQPWHPPAKAKDEEDK